jgi:hypothetical protein
MSRSSEISSLFHDAREALAALTNDASSSASEQGIDTVSSLDDDVRKALDAGERVIQSVVEFADGGLIDRDIADAVLFHVARSGE